MAFRYKHLLILIIFGLVVAAILPLTGNQSAPTVAGIAKTSLCQSLNGLPDPVCTPGAIDSNVTQNNIKTTICVSGYTKTVRPPVSYTNGLKLQQIKEYGYADTNPKDFEEDHLISLEIAGSPIDPKNLWPETYGGSLGAREKDKVENYLHDAVCGGIITLDEAQKEVATDWTKVYQKITP